MRHNRVTNRRGAFTLIEMLVVAALIAIFAGLAVFNLVENLQQEKVKAATAEARSIATAMSFAYQDLSFFPKLCFLKFGYSELAKVVNDDGLGPDSLEYYNHVINPASLSKRWSSTKYLAGSLPEKYCNMTLSSNDRKTYDWPRDPFNQPYVAYLIKMKVPTGGGQAYPTWIETAGDQPNYFAGIVSYGRNTVPGMLDVNLDLVNRSVNDFVTKNGPYRMYTQPNPQDPKSFQMLSSAAFADPGPNPPVKSLLGMLTQKGTAQEPNIRDAGSDDRYFEF